jgi:hypothetical protein
VSQKYNSAARLHRLLSDAAELSGQKTAHEVWAAYFEIDIDDPTRSWTAVGKKLQLILDEFDLLELEMVNTPLPTETFLPALRFLRKGIYLPQLGSQFSQFRSYFDSESLNILEICTALLPDDGVPIDEDELNDFATKLADFREEVESSDLPDIVKSFFLSHIDILQQAIVDYRIRGPVVFVEARFTAMSVSAQKAEDIAPHQDEPTVRNQMQRLSGFWEWVDKLDKVERALAAAESLKEKLLPLASGIMDQL